MANNSKKKVSTAPNEKIAAVEDKIRDLINYIEVMNEEELEAEEGKKIEDDTARNLTKKLREIATMLGYAFD